MTSCNMKQIQGLISVYNTKQNDTGLGIKHERGCIGTKCQFIIWNEAKHD